MNAKITIKTIVILYLAYFGWQLITAKDFYAYSDVSYLTTVDLIFHEAGHTLFMLFGHFLYVLGGSFFQVFLPLFLAGYFFFYRVELFSAGVLFFWAGESATGVAFYAGDAQKMQIPLLGDLGPEGHDWHNILSTLGMLDRTDTVAQCIFVFSWLFFVGAFCVMAYSLYRDIKEEKSPLEQSD